MGSTDAQDVEILLTLSKQAVASVNEYKATQKIDDRLQALEQVRKLARALEQPGDTVYQLALSPTILMAVKIAHDLDVFRVLSATTSFVTCEQLAAPKHSDVLLIERIMRVLVCNGFANERGPGKYGPTQLSRQMTMRTSIGTVECLFMDFLPVYHKTPKFLQETGYKNPADPLHGPFQYAHQTSLSCWDWLARNPGAMDRFNTFMEGSRANAPHWAEYFPVQERLLDGVDLTNRPLLVDVGGGRGHDLLGFKYRFPCHPGKLILEELPSVINDIKTLDRGIKLVKHDFFRSQPVEGARAYYLKHIMHDWSDENCRTILKQIVAVMERGFSKVLIEDHILPDMNVGPRQTLLDMTVMAWCPGAERSRRRWTKLLSSVGLVIKDFWLPDGDREGVIEAELQDTPPGDIPYNVTAEETQPVLYSHINGSVDEALDRYCVSELCKGWPVYRDASEWNNYRDLFTKDEDAYVWTTWSGCLHIDDFIQVSKDGRKRGDFIMHRENSTLVELHPPKQRAIGKMKATITQRFQLPSGPVDIECDCRFIFFCKKVRSYRASISLEWKAQYVKLFYEKDKVIPVDGRSTPEFDPIELSKYPEGYRFLGAAQSRLGHKVLEDLPTLNNQPFFEMYDAMGLWLQGNDVGHALGVCKEKFDA